MQTSMIYMERKALQRHQAYMKARLGVIPSWNDYVREIYLNFWEIEHADPQGN